jgi:GNAT superfamily N-acetyltransferase
VRPASEADLPVMVDLASELREALVPAHDGGLRPGTPAARSALEQRLRDALESPDRQLVLVDGDDGRPVAMALFTVSCPNALLDESALHMSHAMVDDRHRRRGAGRALVAAAAACADERGIEQIVVSVRPGARDANRFFSRLGFAPLAVRRTASVVGVRRRLAQSEPGLGLGARRVRRGRASVPLQHVPPAPAVAATPEPQLRP